MACSTTTTSLKKLRQRNVKLISALVSFRCILSNQLPDPKSNLEGGLQLKPPQELKPEWPGDWGIRHFQDQAVADKAISLTSLENQVFKCLLAYSPKYSCSAAHCSSLYSGFTAIWDTLLLWLFGVHQDPERGKRTIRLSPFLLTEFRFCSLSEYFQIANLRAGNKNETRMSSNSPLKQYLSDSYSQETKKYLTGKISRKRFHEWLMQVLRKQPTDME